MKDKLETVKNRLQEELMEQFDLHQNMEDDEIEERIEQTVLHYSQHTYLSIGEKQALKQELFNAFRKLDVLSGLLEDEDISEIMINGCGHIFIEKNGELRETEEMFSNEERLRNVIQQIVSSCNRIVNETVPIVDARLEDGSRVNVVRRRWH